MVDINVSIVVIILIVLFFHYGIFETEQEIIDELILELQRDEWSEELIICFLAMLKYGPPSLLCGDIASWTKNKLFSKCILNRQHNSISVGLSPFNSSCFFNR